METATGFAVSGCEDSAGGRREYLEVLERRVEASHDGRNGLFGGRGEAGIGAAIRFAKHASVSGRIGSCVKDGMQ
jgi:hypothetical protein